MTDFLSLMEGFNYPSLLFRLLLAMLCGGLLGIGREQKGRAAGFRTYMLTSLGAALTILLAIYEYRMLTGQWASLVPESSLRFDASRYSAQVINGIGFLAAGTIIKVSHQKIKGLTTASGLWASACMGIAAGAGFYSCILAALLLTMLTLDLLPRLENHIYTHSKEFQVRIDFHGMENITDITRKVLSLDAKVMEIELERVSGNTYYHASALFTLRLNHSGQTHADLVSRLASLDCVYSIKEMF